MTKRLKVGIIGCGGIAQSRHIPILKKMNDVVDLTAVFDVNLVLANKVAVENSIEFVAQDKSDLWDKVDAVFICTPNKFHAELSVAALNAGVHVFCEKPMAINSQECDQMIEAAKVADKLLAIGYHYRFTEAAMTAKRAIKEGVVGEPLVTRVQAMRRRKVPGWGVFTNKTLQGGGSLIDYGCHLLDLSLWLLNDARPVEVTGRTYNRLSKTPNQINDWGHFDSETFDVDDHVTSYITFEDGSSLQFECSWSANIKEDTMHLSMSGVSGGLSLYPFEIYQPRFGTFFTQKAYAEHDEYQASQRQAINFVNSCLGKETLVVQPEQARQINVLVDAIYRSNQEQHSIQL
ncbi:Gfo/Idh/MocA family protein [Staphylococcus simulans]|uniref:Gfo/Idh/MocA family protein n=1 Tax=Staphylococcus simulans TaxID=1286 RepID=UPI0021D381C4|nr:Gfo/Idh/MocA family oxidoreductase [Staphylococcus simulans]UXV37686.1 Gfo/Idh/MocA family oxidoreductase [Staphylococcus simulans]UXV40134.1 Gfo/Idh/MocA family oxidoreductase [Staphylococcus simulans]